VAINSDRTSTGLDGRTGSTRIEERVVVIGRR
jgi:hypothetical protein